MVVAHFKFHQNPHISSIFNFIFKFRTVPDPYFHIYLHIPTHIHIYLLFQDFNT